ncbi:MAG: YegS/Rv2252/BmrU family lipid kinase [Candidatus Omnitrophica bacterium]|nr:YegS/Rv2252/BmrU family lipid kinase [Candidatus Omnitrophota bacterium]
MSKKYFLIINPTAHSGRARRDGEKIIALFKERGADFDFEWTKKKEDAISIAHQATCKGYQILVAIGGDGTICEVISGIFAAEVTSRPKLGVIHVGTSPDFNKNHGIALDIEGAAEALFSNNTKIIDIGKVTYRQDLEGGQQRIGFFASNANFGVGPLVVGKSNSRYRKYLGDFLGTLTALLVSLVGFRKVDFSVEIEGKKRTFNKLINLTVGKDPYIGSGMRIFSEIKPDDGKFYIFSIERKTSWSKFLMSIPKLYNGNFLEYSGAALQYASEITINACPQYPFIECDGDIKGYLPAKIEILPKALAIVV